MFFNGKKAGSKQLFQNCFEPARTVKELKLSSFSEKSLFAQGVHVSVRPQQKD